MRCYQVYERLFTYYVDNAFGETARDILDGGLPRGEEVVGVSGNTQAYQLCQDLRARGE